MIRFSLPPLSALLLLLSCNVPTTDATSQTQLEEQAEGVPSVVVATFAQKYPTVTEADWNRDRNDSHEAHFKLDGRKLRADFTPSGTWIETEESIDWDELPEAVQDAIKDEYDKDDIVELEHTDSAEKGDFYDVEIDPKGEKKFDVEYRADGSKL